MTPYAKKAKKKGWKMMDIAERWGVTARRMSQIGKDPSQKDLDALKGLRDLTLESEETKIDED